MLIDGFQKLTLVDFPNNVSCIIFMKKCNYRCPFCYNSSLVLNESDNCNYNEKEIFDYLNKRKNILDGVVISGGEATLQKGLDQFIYKIKNIGYKVKLDTNGSNPKLLKKLIENNLIDYVAMDIKNSFDKYAITSGIDSMNLKNIKESIAILKNSNVDHEFRTTIVKEFHTINDLKKILKYIDGSKYFLQNYMDKESVIQKGLHSFTNDELNFINNELKNEFTNFKIRGL